MPDYEYDKMVQDIVTKPTKGQMIVEQIKSLEAERDRWRSQCMRAQEDLNAIESYLRRPQTDVQSNTVERDF